MFSSKFSALDTIERPREVCVCVCVVKLDVNDNTSLNISLLAIKPNYLDSWVHQRASRRLNNVSWTNLQLWVIFRENW